MKSDYSKRAIDALSGYGALAQLARDILADVRAASNPTTRFTAIMADLRADINRTFGEEGADRWDLMRTAFNQALKAERVKIKANWHSVQSAELVAIEEPKPKAKGKPELKLVSNESNADVVDAEVVELPTQQPAALLEHNPETKTEETKVEQLPKPKPTPYEVLLTALNDIFGVFGRLKLTGAELVDQLQPKQRLKLKKRLPGLIGLLTSMATELGAEIKTADEEIDAVREENEQLKIQLKNTLKQLEAAKKRVA